MKKNTLKYAAAAAVCALAFAGCAKMELPENEVQEGTEAIGDGCFAVTFECEMVGEEEDTKTVFHDNTIWWGVGDQLLFGQWATVSGEKALKTIRNAALTVDKQKMSMNVSSFNTPDDGTEAVYFSVYPSSAYQAYTNSNGTLLPRITLPKDQTPKADCFDPASDILISDYVTSSAKETSLTLRYTRTSAIAKMNITGINSSSPVTSVTFSAIKGGKAVTLAGSAFYDLQEGKMASLTNTSCTKETQINLDYSNLAPDDDFTAYFNCYPFSLGEGDSFKVTATTADGAHYEKEVTLAAGKELVLQAGHGTRFTVNMSTARLYYDWFNADIYNSSTYFTTYNKAYFSISGSDIKSIRYAKATAEEFDRIESWTDYVSANGTDVTADNLTKINDQGKTIIFTLSSLTIDTEYYLLIQAVKNDDTTVGVTLKFRTDWFFLGAVTRSSGGIQGQLAGKDIATMKGYRLVPVSELEGITDYEDYYTNTLKPGNSTADFIASIHAKNGAVYAIALTKDYNGNALVSGDEYVLMVKATNARGETTFRSAKAAAK